MSGRLRPLEPIFNPRARRGAPAAGAAVGTPPPAAEAVTPFLLYDTREWPGGVAPMPNLASSGSAYDMPVDFTFELRANKTSSFPAVGIETTIGGDAACAFSAFTAWRGAVPGNGSNTNMYGRYEGAGAEGRYVLYRFQFSVSAAGAAQALAQVEYYLDSGPPSFTEIEFERYQYTWNFTIASTDGWVMWSMDPVNGGVSIDTSEAAPTTQAGSTAPPAGAAAVFDSVAAGAVMDGNQLQLLSSEGTTPPAVGTPWEVAGTMLGRGKFNAADIAYWTSFFGV